MRGERKVSSQPRIKRLCNGDGEKQIRFANVAVIEEVDDVGAEVIGVESPAAERDGHAELVLFVALAVQAG